MHIHRKKDCGVILKKIIILILGVVVAVGFTACSIKKAEEEKISDIDYTVVEEEDVPKELMKIINDKKEEVFHMTFDNKEYLYMVTGYGPQPSTGYSITVEELYETNNSICFRTGLKGPDKSQKTDSTVTYPYIVVKVEYTDKMVLFQ